MNMRVTRIERTDETTLRVEGRLNAVYIHELARECHTRQDRLVLDLSNLCGIDAAGATLLALLASQGVAMQGASPYITLRIQQQSDSSPLKSLQAN